MTDEKKIENEFGFGDDVDVEPAPPKEAMRRYHLRRALLDPSSHVQQRAVAYSVHMGRAELTGGKVTMTKVVAAPFRAQRILIRALFAPLPPWIVFLSKWFSWIAVPGFAVEWDEDLERDALHLCLTHPMRDLYAWADTKSQRAALQDARLVSVRTQGIEAVVSSIPATMFIAMPVRLELPTVNPGQSIEVVFAGTGGPFDVAIQGVSLE